MLKNEKTTKEEIKQSIHEVSLLIQKLAKEGNEGNVSSVSLLPELIQSVANLITASHGYLN